MLFLDLALQAGDDIRRGIHADIPHDQDLLQLLVEIVVDSRKAAEYGVDPPDDVVSGLRQPLLQSGKKPLLSLCHVQNPPIPVPSFLFKRLSSGRVSGRIFLRPEILPGAFRSKTLCQFRLSSSSARIPSFVR